VLLEGPDGDEEPWVAGEVRGYVDPAELIEAERCLVVLHGDNMTQRGHLRTVLGGTYGSLLILLLWSRTLSPLVLALGAAVLAGTAVLEWRRAQRTGVRMAVPLSQATLALALIAAAATTARLEWGARSWSRVAASREAHLSARLQDRVQGAIRRAEAASGLAAATEPGSFDALEAIRQRTGVDAVVVLDGTGRPESWSGEHRGRIPGAVFQRGEGAIFPGGTLFDYLYVVRPALSGRRAVAAVLMQAGPPLRGATDALAERFEAVTGERLRFSGPYASDADWQLSIGGMQVLTARFPPLGQTEWRGRVARTGRRLVFGFILVAVGLLSAVWLRSLDDRSGLAGMVPMAGFSVVLMVAPLRRTLGLDRLFSPGWFVLPVPGDFVIEGVIVVLLPLAAILSTVRPLESRRSDLWLRLLISAALVGGGFAVGAGLMTASAGTPLLTSGGPLWYVLQPTTVALLTVLAALSIPRLGEGESRSRLLVWAAAGLAVSAALALGLATSWGPDDPLPTPLLFAWAVPFVLLGRGVAGYVGRGDRMLRWLAAGWLASTAVIPHMWVASQAARLEEAEDELASFGARGDPFLNYLLGRFGEELVAADDRGEGGVDLLYEAWVSSGLASEPYPLEISMWDDALRREAYLPLGVQLESGSEPHRDVLDLVQATLYRSAPRNEPAAGGGVSRILAVPLPGGRAVSVAVAPRASLRPTSALTMFMEGEPQRDVTLDLLPAQAFADTASTPVRWRTTPAGWRSETLLQEGNDTYHAHIELRLPARGVRLARAVLLVTLNLLLLTSLWVIGRMTRGDPPVPPGGWFGWLGGFRARLTATLFVFFLLPTAVFGWATYRALAEEVTRAARQIAERAVVHAASVLPGAGIEEAARRTGEDLLYYHRGTLGAASVPEAAELGLYSAWMPPDLYRSMRATESLGATETGELANRRYLVAYRRLRSPVEMVAVPVWLAARDVAVRQRDFAHLVLFGILVGGVLSLVLSVLVGRTLAEPIGDLRRAAGAVGRGHFRVRLPEQRADEFGDLFASFNRMARRLRRARAQEIRTARILAWGEMARQVAHEIKNPLTPIKLSIQHIRRAYEDRRSDFDPILESNVEQILVEIDRLTEIAKAFSRYGAPEEVAGKTEAVDVAAVAREVLTLYRAPDRSVEYRLRLESDDTVAAARALELREVIVNLLENARAAVGEAGTVEVVVGTSGDHVRLEVRDDGAGIMPEQLPRIFDPHFSTRSSGTGLGLAIVRRLVEGWGGQVGAESEAGEGTVVWLVIPGTGAAPAPEGEAGAADGPDH
jgi:signal transduction histidine kinase